jgi:UDP-N-acetylmuramoyl-L-alanyl-D-glutamate--2,6-diaminopimelate ligase
MKLINLLHNLNIVASTFEIPNIEIDNIAFDSRKVNANSLFVAIKGTQNDGHIFISEVIAKGAKTIIVNEDFEIDRNIKNVLIISVKNTTIALAQIASNFYNNPSSKLKLIGITGTNGKTTVATLSYNLFTALGYKCGLISTVENKINNIIIPSTHTTPDTLGLNELLNKMVQNDCEYVFMEVSSHAVHQQRIYGLSFTGGVFTNITHDHLDYHLTFDNYIAAKQSFFDTLPKEAFALTNLDDRRGKIMLQNACAKRYTYSLKNLSDYKAKILETDFEGTLLKINDSEIYIRLVGEFNIYNATAVFGIADLLHQDNVQVLTALSNIKGAKGRFEVIYGEKKKVALVDYAHTPDALENVLQTIIKIKNPKQKLITVVGCGGDRDKSKRPIMASIAANLSDKLILTSDNPRTENPNDILLDMEKGIEIIHQRKVIKNVNREDAIHTAIQMLGDEDIVLVAGKGHENYQEINGTKHHFDDKEIIEKYFKKG